jgi:hypothetical protein
MWGGVDKIAHNEYKSYLILVLKAWMPRTPTKRSVKDCGNDVGSTGYWFLEILRMWQEQCQILYPAAYCLTEMQAPNVGAKDE